MSDFFAYISPGELDSGHDPVRVLRLAATRDALLANRNYDPSHTSLWAKADVANVGAPPIPITNQETGNDELVCVCEMTAQA